MKKSGSAFNPFVLLVIITILTTLLFIAILTRACKDTTETFENGIGNSRV